MTRLLTLQAGPSASTSWPPIVSPHKTVEGAIGGIFGSVLVGVVLTLVYSFLSASHNVITIQVQPRHYAILVVMGAIASVLGILGDLFASSVKRQVGIKDYGTIFPGARRHP